LEYFITTALAKSIPIRLATSLASSGCEFPVKILMALSDILFDITRVVYHNKKRVIIGLFKLKEQRVCGIENSFL
jgi:hypothetical protein